VEEADERRTQRPPWLDADIARAHAVADHKGRCVLEDDDDEEGVCADGSVPLSGRRFVSVGGDTVDDKKCKHARHPSELVDEPQWNHVNIEHYMDCICTVLEQLMPREAAEQENLRRFARAYKTFNQRARGSSGGGLGRVFGGGTGPLTESSLPKLSHCRPTAPVMAMTRTLMGTSRPVLDDVKKKKTPSRKQPSLAEGNMAKKQKSLRD